MAETTKFLKLFKFAHEKDKWFGRIHSSSIARAEGVLRRTYPKKDIFLEEVIGDDT